MRPADRLVTAAEMAEVDRLTIEKYGILPEVLMENAGQKAWNVLARRVSPSGGAAPDILFIAGNGNNGGDVLVMARQAIVERTVEPRIITLTRKLTGLSARQWAIIERMGGLRYIWDEDEQRCAELIGRADWIVDGITGTGLRGRLRSAVESLVDSINAAPGRRLCVDVPSGLRDNGPEDEPRVRADVTVVTGYLKTMLYEASNREHVGEIVRVDPGFPPTLVERTDVVSTRASIMPREERHPAPLHADMHKGDRGRALIVGGASGAPGAPVLAAAAAAAAGVGMVRMLGSHDAVAASLARDPSIMAAALPSVAEADSYIKWADSAVLGPGWLDLTDRQLGEWISACDAWSTALVIDATALRVLAERRNAWERLSATRVPVVLTPHLGEWRALTRGDGSIARLGEEDVPDNVTIIVKSAVTAVRWGDGSIEVLDGRAPALATAGSGDVLAGLVGGSLARLTGSRAGGAGGNQEREDPFRAGIRWALTHHLDAGRGAAADGVVPSAARLVERIELSMSGEYR